MPAILSWETKAGELEIVTFDAFDSEDWDGPCEVSEFPVELAPGMTDQIIVKPWTVALVGYVSEKPLATNDPSGAYASHSLTLPGSPKYVQKTQKLDIPGSPLKPNIASLVTAGFNALTGAGGYEVTIRQRQGETPHQQSVRSWSYDNFESRVVAMRESLELARYERALIFVVSDHKQVENMVIEGLQLGRKPEDGSGAVFTLNLRQIQVAESKTVAAPQPAETAAQMRKAVGTKSAETAGDDEVAKLDRSVLSALGGAVSDAVHSLIGGGH